MIFCSKPFKYPFKTTDFCRKYTPSLISDLRPMGYIKLIFQSNFDWVRYAFGTRDFRQTCDFYHPQGSQVLPWKFQIWGLWVKWKSFFGQTLIGSDRPLEPQIFVRHMIFIIPKGHSCYPENFRITKGCKAPAL